MKEERPGSAVEDAVLITDALVIPGSGDPHWDESARTIIEGVILEVATAKRSGRRNLVTVRDLLAEGDNRHRSRERRNAQWTCVLEGYMRASMSMPPARGRDFRAPGPRAGFGSIDRPPPSKGAAFPEIAASLSGEGFDLAGLKTRA